MQEGICRIKLKNGLVDFGVVLKSSENHVTFRNFEPSASELFIPIKDVLEIEKYNENDVPAYE